MKRTCAAAEAETPPFRDDDGALRQDFIDQVKGAIEAENGAILTALVGEMHQADVGDLLEALDPELRPRLIELMGGAFDFTALTEVDDTVREEILEELPAETVAKGVQEIDSDDAVYILEDLPKEEQADILRAAAGARAHRAGAQPVLPGRLGRPAHADRVHRRAAVLDRGPDHRLHARNPDLPDRFYEIFVVDPAYRFQGAVALDRLLRTKRPVAMSRAGRRGAHPRARDRGSGEGRAPVRALQPGRGAGGRRREAVWSASSPSTTSST